MMITQLKNQDPTDPTSNEEILSQISQIGQLQSSDTLESDLSSMVLQNGISNAGSLIGKTVTGVDDQGNSAKGTVNSVDDREQQDLSEIGQRIAVAVVQCQCRRGGEWDGDDKYRDDHERNHDYRNVTAEHDSGLVAKATSPRGSESAQERTDAASESRTLTEFHYGIDHRT